MAERDPILNQPPETVPLSAAEPEARATAPVIVVEQQAPTQQPVQPIPVIPVAPPKPARTEDDTVILISHSPLVYWWPVWLSGYVMAALTYFANDRQSLENTDIMLYPHGYLGVIFLLILFSVIVISNVHIRGYASGMVIMTMITGAVILAYFDLWQPVLKWLGKLNVFLNLGAYFWFSTLLFILWFVTVFIIDRFNYMRVTPGQITSEAVLGAASRSYDTENMVFEKHRDDLFRHWILGFGSGDLKITTHGAQANEISLRNVLFIGPKVNKVQRLIASEPDASTRLA